MAEGTVISITKKLGVMLLEEYKFLTGVEGQVASLRDELEWISSFLRDAALMERKSERVDVWVSQVRNLAYSAEDAIDTFIHKVRYERDTSWLRFFSRLPFVSYPGPPIAVHNLGNEIESIKAKIERISANRSKYAPDDQLQKADSLGEDVIFERRTAPDPELGDAIVGFDNQSNEVKAKLSLTSDHEDSSQLHVVSIFGGPGAGKSTLASKVYDEIKTQFDTYVWIDVSKDFRPEDLLQSINREKMPGKEDFGKLLVVFDGVRRTQDWVAIQEQVLGRIGCMDKKGSRVLVTSCSYEVGRQASSREDPYRIRGLVLNKEEEVDQEKINQEKKDGMELLGLKALDKGSIPPELKNEAEAIVESCSLLPLVIVLLGGLLSRKQAVPNVWKKVKESLQELLKQGYRECPAAVALSYDNLPNYLGPCFLYFGLFPQGCLIDCENLTQLWIAEGFIHERGEKSMEDIADDYLEEFIQRGMIQVHRRRSNGSVEICRINDAIAAVAISKGRHDKFLDIVGNKDLTKANHTVPRRLAIHSSTSRTTDNDDEEEEEEEEEEEFEGSEIVDSKTRSIICFADLSKGKLERASLYRNLIYLRVLDLRGSKKLKKLPHEIGKLLVLLKYLNLRGTRTRKLPSSVRNLVNLQTLDISETRIACTPSLVWELKELRHFYANLDQVKDNSVSSSDDTKTSNKGGFCRRDFLRKVSCNSNASGVAAPQTKTRRLKNLLTLSTREDGWICKIEFSRLTNLRKLKITKVNMKLDGYAQLLSNSIPKFVFLRELEIEWDKGILKFPSFARHVHLYKMRLSGKIELTGKAGQAKWVFPPNLAEAGLSRVMLDQDGIDALSKLNKLKFLELKGGSFREQTMVFPEDGFPWLSRLDLEQLSELTKLVVKKNSLSELKILNLCCLEKLVELPSGLEKVRTLKTLKLFVMPLEFIARIKKIEHIPTIAINGSLYRGDTQFNAASDRELAGASV